MSTRKPMPSKKRISEWWRNNTEMFDIPYDNTLCWGCGFHGNIQRCHIHAHVDGGTEHESNLVLLCKHCHSLQELQCLTEEGRKHFLDLIIDGAPYLPLRYETLKAQFLLLPDGIKKTILDKAMRRTP